MESSVPVFMYRGATPYKAGRGGLKESKAVMNPDGESETFF